VIYLSRCGGGKGFRNYCEEDPAQREVHCCISGSFNAQQSGRVCADPSHTRRALWMMYLDTSVLVPLFCFLVNEKEKLSFRG
jgi:hypothetical protein